MRSPRNELVVHAVQMFQLVNWVPHSAGSIRTGRLSSRGYCGRRAQWFKKQISKKKNVLIFGPVRTTRQYDSSCLQFDPGVDFAGTLSALAPESSQAALVQIYKRRTSRRQQRLIPVEDPGNALTSAKRATPLRALP